MQALIDAVVNVIRVSAAARRISVDQLRAETRDARLRQRHALTRQRVSRQVSARALRRALHRQRAAIIVATARMLAPAAAGCAGESEPLPARVLRIVAAHPEGITALDVGNELGIDWRGVLEAMGALVDAGDVEQIDHQFYPAKARRSC